MSIDVKESKKKERRELAKDAIKKARQTQSSEINLVPPRPPGPDTHSVAQRKKKKK